MAAATGTLGIVAKYDTGAEDDSAWLAGHRWVTSPGPRRAGSTAGDVIVDELTRPPCTASSIANP